jgi:phenylpropionate dioxygenase-like ring-hydroxylating dioxygenase large terminal subunit
MSLTGSIRAHQGGAVARALTNTDPALRRCWHPVARCSDVTDQPHGVLLLGEPWVLACHELALPLDPTAEVHTRADRATLELRRVLGDLLVAVEAGRR